jgi:hypothetical protein
VACQAPEQFVESVQRLIDYLDRQGISTQEIQKKVVSQVIIQRAKRDNSFHSHLLRWERLATKPVRLSTIGQAVHRAIAFLATEPRRS